MHGATIKITANNVDYTHVRLCTASVCLCSRISMSVTITGSTDQDQLLSSVPTFPFMHLITVLVTTLKMYEIIAEFKFGTIPRHFALSHNFTVRHIQGGFEMFHSVCSHIIKQLSNYTRQVHTIYSFHTEDKHSKYM